MGRYIMLGGPKFHDQENTGYKGLYRLGVAPSNSLPPDIFELCVKSSYFGDVLGYTFDMFSFIDSKQIINYFREHIDPLYELIYFSSEKDCPMKSIYYGMDVVGQGGYSMLSEGLFRTNPMQKNHNIVNTINKYFLEKLNQQGLFDHIENAQDFQGVLNEWNNVFSFGDIEDEDWEINHIFKIFL